MRLRELLARLTLGLIVIGLPLAALGYQYWLRPATSPHRVIDIAAQAPEHAGFSPDAIRVAVGETVTLRFASMDVTHGIAIGPGLGVDLGPIDPGEVKEVTLRFDHPGIYTYYCTTWCSPDHWRMRGTIEVSDPANPELFPSAAPDPVIETLIAEGVDIDAVHAASADHGSEMTTWAFQPSAQRGEAVIANGLEVPVELRDPEWRQSNTPSKALELLTAHNPAASERDLLDAVAYLWTQDVSEEALTSGERLYNQNCAACHGQYGGGDGPAAGTTAEDPVAFADTGYMVERRSDVLYAKIRRGGMGTDMPNFGTLFTPEETWTLVRYLWTLAFGTPPGMQTG